MRGTKETALIVTAAMVLASITACGMPEKDAAAQVPETVSEENKTDEDKLMDAMSAVSTVGATMAQKQETVYVKTNACGAVDSVVVSDWLKNSGGSGELMDETNLTDIKNVKGTQQFEKNGSEMVWDASGEDIYYQGTTDKDLPVEVKISYQLYNLQGL